MLTHVGWPAFHLFEGEAESFGVVVLTFGQLEVSNQALQLVKHVIVKYFALVLLVVFSDAIIHAEDVVAEGRCHEELLHHTVHVANATKVPESDVLLESSILSGRLVVPLVWILDLFEKRSKLLFHKLVHQYWTLFDQLQEKRVSCFTALVVLGASGCLLLFLFCKLDGNLVRIALFLRVERSKEELPEDFPDEVFFLNNLLADLCFNFSDDLAHQLDQANPELFIAFSFLLCKDVIFFVITGAAVLLVCSHLINDE